MTIGRCCTTTTNWYKYGMQERWAKLASTFCPAPTINLSKITCVVMDLSTCELRDRRYVGMTVTVTSVSCPRLLQHLRARAANGRQEQTAFGNHYRTAHGKKDQARLSIKHDDLRLHVEEVLQLSRFDRS